MLAVNGGRCPLSDLAARFTDDRAPRFDIYLPHWLAERNKVIFGMLFIAGELVATPRRCVNCREILSASYALGCARRRELARPGKRIFIGRRYPVLTFVLWCILFVLCWPIALLALVLYPIVWLLLLPFRIVGIAVDGVLKLLWAIVTFPARLLRAPGRV